MNNDFTHIPNWIVDNISLFDLPELTDILLSYRSNHFPSRTRRLLKSKEEKINWIKKQKEIEEYEEDT